MDLRGVEVLVVGMARSGLAALELLLDKGARLRATDLNPPAAETAAQLERWGVEFRLQTPEVFEGAGWIVLSPGVPADLEPLVAARQRGARVIPEVELAHRRALAAVRVGPWNTGTSEPEGRLHGSKVQRFPCGALGAHRP